MCALKPDILLYPPEARYIKETSSNLHRIYMSEESHETHEIFFLFSCTQIDTYIKQLDHTSVRFNGAGGAALLRDGGIICVTFREFHWCHRVVPNIVIKCGTAGTVLKLKCGASVVHCRRA